MEHCERGDLAMLLEARAAAPLAEGEVWAHLLQTASGLHHLHSRKVLHRDLKAKNLFLAADGVKIGDLGVARLLGASTEFASTVVGTPYYLSPELCENAPYNEKSDVWALGVVLYEMLALRRPFEARNQGALLLKILRAEYAPPPAERYTPPLLALLGRCLQRDPAARPSARELLAAPAAALDDAAAADGDGDGGGGDRVPTTLPAWQVPRGHHGQGSNIPFGEFLTLTI